MRTRSWVVGLALVFSGSRAALAQAPTPTPVDSNIAVSTYAQNHGNPCSGGPGSVGCGGCYPGSISNDTTALLNTVNPEWQPIGPMISGGDASLPPASEPVLFTGTVALSKINESGDFTGSHLTDDQNTFIVVDSEKNGLLATGNGGTTSCPGEGCSQIEMEREIGKYPLFAWAGEGDRIAAVGRWIFDCGHPDAEPTGKCSNSSSTACVIDTDCPSGGTCTNPAPTFNFRAELHPPQAIAVIRNKSKSNTSNTPATRADVYISADAGGAGDTCTVTHLASFADVLSNKKCFLNQCSVTTSQSCLADTDCPKKETCIRLDPAQQVLNVNASDFTFDLPLPAKPPSATAVKITTKNQKVPKGSVMPKATFVPDLAAPTPVVHVTVPMSVPFKGKTPNVFAQSITAAWKSDPTKLTHVQVKFTKLTVNNPLKPTTPVIHNCSDLMGGPLTSTQCLQDSDCPTGSQCVIVDTPGWGEYGQVNGDWIQFTGLDHLGARNQKHPPTYPLAISQKSKFDEYVLPDGKIHIATTGHSLNCIDTQYGHNLLEGLTKYGFTLGATCLLDGMDGNPGPIAVAFTGPGFATPSGACSTKTTQTCNVDTDCPTGETCKNSTTCTTAGTLTTCTTTSSGRGDGGTCTSGALCMGDTDCPTGETCTVTGGAFALTYTLQVK